MLTAVGKSLFVDQRGRLFVVSREVDRDGTVAYALAAVELRYVDGYRHKYEAVQAADHIVLEREDAHPSTGEPGGERPTQ